MTSFVCLMNPKVMLKATEGYLKEHYKLNVNHGKIYTSFKDFIIDYSIENLHIESKGEVNGHIKKITASLDILQSISNLKFFFTDVSIFQSRIQSDVQINKSGSSLDLNRISTYLILKKFLISDSEFKLNKKNIFKIKKISSQLNQDKLSLNYVTYFNNTSLIGVGDISKNKLGSGLNGNIKLYCNSLNINEFYDSLGIASNDNPITGSNLNFTLDAKILSSKLEFMTLRLDKKSTINIRKQNYKFYGRINYENREFKFHNITLKKDLNKIELPTLSFRQKENQSIFKISKIDSSILMSLGHIMFPNNQFFQKKITGSMSEIQLLYKKNYYHFLSKINGIELNNKNVLSNVKIDSSGTLKKGIIHLFFKNSALNFNENFTKDIHIKNSNLELNWSKNKAEKIFIESKKGWLHDKNISIKPQFYISFEKGVPDKLKINTKVSLKDISKIKNYLPKKLISKTLYNFLSTRITMGEVKDGTVHYDGYIKDFPFKVANKGLEVNLPIHNSSLIFEPKWPKLMGLDLLLKFKNDSLYISTKHAIFCNEEPTHLSAFINKLSVDGNLEVQFGFKEKAQKLIACLSKTPLHDKIGMVFEKLQPKGILRGDFKLNFPLKNFDTHAKGTIYFENNVFEPASLKKLFHNEAKIKKINGSININNSTVTSSNLSFDVFNQLNNISLKGYESGNNYKLKIKGLSHVRLMNLINIKNVNLDGSTILKSKIDLTFKPNRKYDYDVSVNGVMHEMRTNLPFPLDTKPQKNKLMVLFKGSEKKDLIEARFNNVELGARNENSSSKSSYWKYSINNYDKEKKLDLLQWVGFLSAFNTAHATNSNSENKAHNFSIKFNKLYLANTLWKNISLDNEIKKNKIKLQIKSKQMKGLLLLDNNKLIANFDKIYLQSVKSSRKETNKSNTFSSIDDKSVFNNWLKSIRIQVNDLKFNKVQLGTLFILIEKDDSKISMPVLSLFNSNNYVKASGLWKKSRGNFKTKLDVSAKSKNIDQILKNIISNYPLRDQSISGNLSLNWLGSPFNPQLSSLNGTSNLISNNGKIIDLGSKVNILSFLSVQSLLIKIQDGMKGDFSGGLNYDKIEIRSLMKNGTVFTNKAQMSSPNLNLSLNGKVDLYRKKVDLKAVAKPSILGIIPTAGIYLGFQTLITSINPWVGAGTFILAAPFIDEYSTQRYLIKGPLNDPKIIEY